MGIVPAYTYPLDVQSFDIYISAVDKESTVVVAAILHLCDM
jgi:hypothetical protein